MCGIAGWVDFARDLGQEEEVIRKMTGTLARRGPDAAGFWLSRHALLGHRRLIVLDPAGGEQPMTRRQGEKSYTITYNGELYNMPELRQELTARGHRFRTYNSDTETLLLAYMEWGADCVTRLNGIFAFAVWDAGRQKLFMARDRLGVKPLFYKEHRGGLIFASEPKAILMHPGVDAVVNEEGLAEILLLGPARTPGHGVFKGFKEVKPGHCLSFNSKGLQLNRYWALESKPHTDGLEETALRVRELLQEATERQLISDVPICTLLSGGLDSSALTSFAASHLQKTNGGKLKTFSVDYRGNEDYFASSSYQPDADAPWIRYVSEHLGTEHHSVTVEIEDLAGALQTATLARDLPGMADIDSSLYLFCQEIKKEATVALSGEAADEIFGGYPWFRQEDALWGGTFPWIRSVEKRRSLLSGELQKTLRGHDYIQSRYEETVAEVPRLPGEEPLEQRRRELFYLNITWFMSTLLDRKDRMSMATGLEVRVPFCDHHLVEYVWNIPWEIKYIDKIAKGILRRALRGVLPPKTLTRRKSPYPKTHHPLYLQIMKEQLLRILANPSSSLTQLVDGKKISAMIKSGQNPFPEPWFGQLMGEAQYYAYLIQIDTWLNHHCVIIET
jgi:asparagine synthase (glutamine-hydrolysing)